MKMFTGNGGQLAALGGRVKCALFCVSIAVLFFSCASRPPEEKPSVSAFFSLFLPADDAPLASNDLYAVIPVQGNEALLKTLARGVLPEKDSTALLARTDTVYLAYSLSFTNEFKLAAAGRFPKNLSSFLFPERRGWQKRVVKNASPPPASLPPYYEAKAGRNTVIQVAIPEPGLALAATGGMQTMLTRAHTLADSFAGDDAVLAILETPSPAVRFFIPDAQPQILRYFAGDLTLPVEYVAGFALPVQEGGSLAFYDTTLCLKLIDSRFAKAALLLLRGLLKPFPDAVITVEDGRYLTVRGLSLSLETIERIR